MQPGVTPIIKQGVIEDWIRGLNRDEIAQKHLIATGSVTNIIRKWVADLHDGDIVDAMRYLAVAFRKLKLTIPQCALGARTGIMMNNLGIRENDFDEFISRTYKVLTELGLDPKKMAHFIQQVEDLAGTMPIAQIPQYIAELDAKKKQISEDIENLEAEELDRKAKVEILKKEQKDLGREFQQFSDCMLELKKYGLEFNDLESFAETVKQAQELGYDAHLIGSKLRYWDELRKREFALEESVHRLKLQKERLE